MFEQCVKNFGKVQTFVSLYENVNLLVLPMKLLLYSIYDTQLILTLANTEQSQVSLCHGRKN